MTTEEETQTTDTDKLTEQLDDLKELIDDETPAHTPRTYRIAGFWVLVGMIGMIVSIVLKYTGHIETGWGLFWSLIISWVWFYALMVIIGYGIVPLITGKWPGNATKKKAKKDKQDELLDQLTKLHLRLMKLEVNVKKIEDQTRWGR